MHDLHYYFNNFDRFTGTLSSFFSWQLFEGVKHVVPADDLSKHCMFVVEIGRGLECDIKLRPNR